MLYTVGEGGPSKLYALSEATGEPMWAAQVNGNEGSPAVDDSGVYADMENCGNSSGFNLNGTIRWTNLGGCSSCHANTPVLNGSHVYLHGSDRDDPTLIFSTATGAAAGSFGGTRRMPAFDAANMYVVRDGPTGGVLDAVDKSGSPTRWTFTGDSPIAATPVTTNGIVFTGSWNGHLYGIDSTTRRQVWTATAPGRVFTADGFGILTGLAAADGLLVVPAGGFLTVYTN